MSKRVGGSLIDLIEIRTFFAVDFDGDVQVVHQCRGLGIFEAFMVHHMAPMARGEADGEQDRLAGRLGLVERFRPPGAPMHGIVLVQQQIGTRFLVELIAAHDLSRLVCVPESGRGRRCGKAVFGRSLLSLPIATLTSAKAR